MTITTKTIRDNWLLIGTVLALASGTLKAKWTVDDLDKRVTALELRVKALEDANFIRQGATEVWKMRGLVGPPPPKVVPK